VPIRVLGTSTTLRSDKEKARRTGGGRHCGPQKRPTLRPLRKLAGMCKNPQVGTDRPAVAERMADVATAVARRAVAVSEDV